MAAAYYAVDPSTFTTDIVSYTFAGYTYDVDMNKNTFRYNTYTKNFATNNRGLITIIGSPRTYFEHESFVLNGDASWESTNIVGYSYYIFPNADYEQSGANI